MDDELVLPPGCGRDELVSKCFSALEKKPRHEIVSETCQMIVANSSNEVVDGIWQKQFAKANGADFTRWLRYGLYLGALARLDVSELERKFALCSPTIEQLHITLNAGHTALIEKSQTYTKLLLDGILDDRLRVMKNNSGVLGQFCEAIQPSRYVSAFRNPIPQPLRVLIRPDERGGAAVHDGKGANGGLLGQCLEFVSMADKEINRSAAEWASEPTSWANLIELARSFWGDRPILFHLANLAAGINVSDVSPNEPSDLLDASRPLCDRIRYARSRAGAVAWWEKQFATVNSPFDRTLVFLTFLSWSGIKTLGKFIERIDAELSQLEFEDWAFLARSLPHVVHAVRARRDRIVFEDLPKKLNERTVLAVSSRCTSDDTRRLYDTFLHAYDGGDQFVSSFCVRIILEAVDSQPKLWQHLLSVLRGLEATGPARDPYHFFRGVGSVSQTMPLEVARKMAQEPNVYPRAWVYAATERCELDAASHVEAVGLVAQKEGWFKGQ